MNSEMHECGPPFISKKVSVLAETRVEDPDDTVDILQVVEPETAMRVTAPIATLRAIVLMHAQNGNTLRREETANEIIFNFGSSVGSHATFNSIFSATIILNSGVV